MQSITDTDLLCDAFFHLGERRRKRLSSYYICAVCDNQYLYGIPQKTRSCPVCDSRMHMVSVVDEFETGRMDAWSEGNILRGNGLSGLDIFCLQMSFLMRDDVGQKKKDEVKSKMIGQLRKELC